jgi:hypothetical protein
MTPSLDVEIEEFDEADVPRDNVKVSVGELEGDDLPEEADTDLSDCGVALPEEEIA